MFFILKNIAAPWIGKGGRMFPLGGLSAPGTAGVAAAGGPQAPLRFPGLGRDGAIGITSSSCPSCPSHSLWLCGGCRQKTTDRPAKGRRGGEGEAAQGGAGRDRGMEGVGGYLAPPCRRIHWLSSRSGLWVPRIFANGSWKPCHGRVGVSSSREVSPNSFHL